MSLLPVKQSDQMEDKPKENVEKFVCDLCDKAFDKKGPMSNHRILVHTIRSKEMHCDFCKEMFNNKKELCSHISNKHSEHFIKQAQKATVEVKEEEKI